MLFKKYPSIENSYQQKYINWFASNSEVDLNTEQFVLQLKLDGANFQVYITEDSYHFGKRTSALGEEASFYGYQAVVEKYEDKIIALQKDIPKGTGMTLILYGELFGSNIQKRISYCEDKRILIYDVFVEHGEGSGWLTPVEVAKLFNRLGIEDWLVPTLVITTGIQAALDFVVEGVETSIGSNDWNPYNNRMIEGVVIKPLSKVLLDRNGSPFRLKQKSKLFNDKMKVKSKAPAKMLSEEAVTLRDVYAGYLNKNRVADYMGKEGEIDNPKQIGAYIKGISADAREDFLKDHQEDLAKLDPKEAKTIMGIPGSILVPLLKEYL